MKLPPTSAAAASPVTESMSPITTLAPSAAKRLAVASPMPDAPPVITATFPARRWVRSIFVIVIFSPSRLGSKRFFLL